VALPGYLGDCLQIPRSTRYAFMRTVIVDRGSHGWYMTRAQVASSLTIEPSYGHAVGVVTVAVPTLKPQCLNVKHWTVLAAGEI